MTNDPMTNYYKKLNAGFTQWLRILNFEPTSQRDMPKMLTEFLEYLEKNNCNHIHDIRNEHLKDYLKYLEERPNRKWGGGLSRNYIRKQLHRILPWHHDEPGAADHHGLFGRLSGRDADMVYHPAGRLCRLCTAHVSRGLGLLGQAQAPHGGVDFLKSRTSAGRVMQSADQGRRSPLLR